MEDFIDYIQQEYDLSPAYIFCGQADAHWPVLSSLDRQERDYPTKTIRVFDDRQRVQHIPRDVHFKAFKQSATGRRGLNPPDLTEDEWWALGQHHGLATPMLDWTLSPFVALFFAFEQKCIQNRKDPPKCRAVFALSANAVNEYHHTCPK